MIDCVCYNVLYKLYWLCRMGNRHFINSCVCVAVYHFSLLGLCTEDQSGKLWFGLVCHSVSPYISYSYNIDVRVMDY